MLDVITRCFLGVCFPKAFRRAYSNPSSASYHKWFEKHEGGGRIRTARGLDPARFIEGFTNKSNSSRLRNPVQRICTALCFQLTHIGELFSPLQACQFVAHYKTGFDKLFHFAHNESLQPTEGGRGRSKIPLGIIAKAGCSPKPDVTAWANHHAEIACHRFALRFFQPEGVWE